MMGKKKKCLGWREWVSLPDLGVTAMKVKVDSGAKTSAIHAEDIKIVKIPRTRKKMVHFSLYPDKKERTKIRAHALLRGRRRIRSSIGHVTVRPVIKTILRVNDEEWPIEVTLINRDIMGFRMLLGRSAIQNGFLIDPAHSFLLARPRKRSR